MYTCLLSHNELNGITLRILYCNFGRKGEFNTVNEKDGGPSDVHFTTMHCGLGSFEKVN